MAAYLRKQGQKLVTATAHAQISQIHCSAPLEAFSYTEHAKSCQDTTCQTYMNKQASNMAAYLLKQGKKLVTATAQVKHHKHIAVHH